MVGGVAFDSVHVQELKYPSVGIVESLDEMLLVWELQVSSKREPLIEFIHEVGAHELEILALDFLSILCVDALNLRQQLWTIAMTEILCPFYKHASVTHKENQILEFERFNIISMHGK